LLFVSSLALLLTLVLNAVALFH